METEKLQEGFEGVFGSKPEGIAFAPGRIEFIGNHTDYNGGSVLGVALDRGVYVAGARRSDRKLRLFSEGYGQICDLNLGDFEPRTGPVSWVNYVLGILSELSGRGQELQRGADLYFASDLHSGAGLSSSAAIELASLEIFDYFQNIQRDPAEKAQIGQAAENNFVGMPCGILDQGVSAFGKVDHLVRIDCGELNFLQTPMPADLAFWVFTTGVKHKLVDSFYGKRHQECRDALQLLQAAGQPIQHLAQASPESLEEVPMPENVAKRARHIVMEHRRVALCQDALARGNVDAAGQLLFESHRSSRDLFENSIPELDTLVDLLEARKSSGVIGARLTGGGFGGAVMAVTTTEFSNDIASEVIAEYGRIHPDRKDPGAISVRSGDGARILSAPTK